MNRLLLATAALIHVVHVARGQTTCDEFKDVCEVNVDNICQAATSTDCKDFFVRHDEFEDDDHADIKGGLCAENTLKTCREASAASDDEAKFNVFVGDIECKFSLTICDGPAFDGEKEIECKTEYDAIDLGNLDAVDKGQLDVLKTTCTACKAANDAATTAEWAETECVAAKEACTTHKVKETLDVKCAASVTTTAPVTTTVPDGSGTDDSGESDTDTTEAPENFDNLCGNADAVSCFSNCKADGFEYYLWASANDATSFTATEAPDTCTATVANDCKVHVACFSSVAEAAGASMSAHLISSMFVVLMATAAATLA